MAFVFTDDEDTYGYDVHMGNMTTDNTPEELGQTIAYHIGQKGYCVVDSGISLKSEDLQSALDEAKGSHSKFAVPPVEIIDGILGEEGTGRVCDIPGPGAAQNSGMQSLSRVDTFLSEMLHCMTPSFGDLGISTSTSSRTKGFLVEGGSNSDNGTDMTEKTCSKWMNIFLRHKLMVLLCLGPGSGTLELRPYIDDDDVGEDDESDWCDDIVTKPGMLIIVRADYLSHHHSCSDQDYMLCTYLLGPALTGGRGPRNEMKGLGPVIPAAKELTEWAMNRALEIKAQSVADGALATLDAKVPRSWERAMNHMFCTGLPVGIFGESMFMPGARGAENLWKALNAGADFVVEVPPTRWDHSAYFDQEPESYKASNFLDIHHCVTSIRHGSFMEGLEQFDTKFFGLSPGEAKGMDPNQRMVLETSYEALHMAGYRKKQLSNAYIGVYGGSTNPEWAQVPMESGAFSGTGTSEAIFCNRVSFCLGMQGPSTNIDCEMASSACAFYVACSQVTPSNERHATAKLDNPAALANGGYVMMTPMFWPRFNFWMNPNGRCFSFNDDAAGYVRGEGTGSFCLKPYVQKVDGAMMVTDETPLGICSGYRMNNNGRNASMQAPNAAAEQDAVLAVLRQASISPLDVDAQECFGIGNLLADAIEVNASAKVYRGTQGANDSAFMIGSVKTQLGAQCEVSGHAQIAKAVWSQRHGACPATNHLKALNPHIELDERPVMIQTEPLSYRCRATYHAIAARGFGGTNVNLLFWNKASEENVPVSGLRPSFRHDNWLLPSADDALEDDEEAGNLFQDEYDSVARLR